MKINLTNNQIGTIIDVLEGAGIDYTLSMNEPTNAHILRIIEKLRLAK